MARPSWPPRDDWHLCCRPPIPTSPGRMYLGGLLCISIFYSATNQFIVQRTLAAKDEWHARMGVVFADYLKFFMPLIYLLPGLVAPLLFPNLEKADMVFPTLVQNLLPTGLVGLVMAGLIAAVMSHISGAVNSCTTIATVDFYLPYIRKRPARPRPCGSARSRAWSSSCSDPLGRPCCRTRDKPIFLYLLNAYGYFTPGIATMFLLGILWKRTTHAGALAAVWRPSRCPPCLSSWLHPCRSPSAHTLQPFMNRTGIVFWLLRIDRHCSQPGNPWEAKIRIGRAGMEHGEHPAPPGAP